MKTLIIYYSYHHLNTEKIAKAMASVLKAKTVKPGKVNAKMLKKYDLIGFGSGIYLCKHHKSIYELINKLPRMNKEAFIFSTSGIRELGFINVFNKPLKEELVKKGFNVKGVFSCRGYDTFGPFKLVGGISKGRPNRKDIEKAKEFARRLKK